MSVTQIGSTFDVVTDDTGEQIRERRTRLGLSIKQLAERAGVDRDTLTNLENGGNARLQTVGAIKRALAELETEPSRTQVRPIGDPAEGLVEFEVEGHFGVRAVVRGPIKDIDKLQEAVARLIAGMDKPHPDG